MSYCIPPLPKFPKTLQHFPNVHLYILLNFYSIMIFKNFILILSHYSITKVQELIINMETKSRVLGYQERHLFTLHMALRFDHQHPICSSEYHLGMIPQCSGVTPGHCPLWPKNNSKRKSTETKLT